MTNGVQKLKTSLTDVIQEWINSESESDGWSNLNTYVGDNLAELMSDSAFAVLLAQADLTKYYKENNMLDEK